MDTSQIQGWLQQNLLLLIVVAGGLIVAYVYSGPFVRKLVRRILRPPEAGVSGTGVEAVELEKRSATIESLAITLIRLSIIAIGVFIFIALTGGGTILLVIGLFVAGVAIAGQSIVLDYLMGIIIIIEGTFFKGDNIELANRDWKGTVEDVGLRRTVVRDVDGTVYSISNGELRMVANRTRIYASGEVRVRGIRQGDLRRILEIMEQVGKAVAADPEFESAIIEAPGPRFVDEADELGSLAVMRGKVVASERWRVATEVRVCLDEALAAEGIELNRKALSEGWRGQKSA